MNTNHLKKFAQSARKLLLEDVSKRLLYWGIDSDGEVVHELTRTSGGYLFRGEVYNDQSIPDKWNNLISAIKGHSIEDVIEEAAYTWFNRLIAIKILEKNEYDQEVLAYVSEELSDPLLLQNAKKGILPSADPTIVADLKQAVLKSNDDELFSMLLIHYCSSHKLLNNIFGHINDYTELLIPQTLLTKGGLLELINSEESISNEDYSEVELIGWLYQFYISDKKDEVFAGFKKKKKARAEDIPAATQIFTPKWIVKYLVENTVGRIWLDLHPESPIRETLTYLVEPENPTQDDPIIQDVTELKVLDPAVGSGHFLVVAFDLLMEMYQEEGYTKRKAVQSIITSNLYGLDICPRAIGLANFALLLKGASHHPEILSENLKPNIHAMPEPFDFQHQQIQDFLGESSEESVDEIQRAFIELKKGQNIGSALILHMSETTRVRIEAALSKGYAVANDLENQMTINRLIPYAQIAIMLTQFYPTVVTNPPYMGSKNMNADLVNYLKTHYPRSKSDLFAVFMEVCTFRNPKAGLLGMINQHSWMFLSSYEKLRKFTLNNYTIKSMLHLGPRLFDELSGEVVQSTSFIQKRIRAEEHYGDYFRLIEYKSSDAKHNQFIARTNHFNNVIQSTFSMIPGSPITYWLSDSIFELFSSSIKLSEKFKPKVGLNTTDNKQFLRMWHEINHEIIGFNIPNAEEAKNSKKKWFPYNKGGGFRKWYGNNEYFVNWWKDGYDIKTAIANDPAKQAGGRVVNENCYFRPSLSWSLAGSKVFCVRYSPKGAIFDVGGSSIFPDEKNMFTLAGFLSSSVSNYLMAAMNPTFNFQAGNVAALPMMTVDQYFTQIKQTVEHLIQIHQGDWDAYEISWDFEKTPLVEASFQSSSIAHTYMKLMSHWDNVTLETKRLEEENNSIFIETYGLQKELTSEVPLNEITLTCNPHYRYGHDKTASEFEKLLMADTIKELISYSTGCFMGRYRLDETGLNIAHPNPTDRELSAYEYNGYNLEIDDDAIIPILGSESPFSDDIVQRVQQFVLMVWGEESYTENLNFINEALGEELEKYLTKKFWDHHKKMYKKRPIYWQFASPKGAFKVITYMHRMNRFTVQVIRKNYLFKQMNWLEREIGSLVRNEATLQTNESKRLDKLRKDLIECREYDLLLKDMADRQIEFDLDDGVVENYKLFDGVVSKI